MLQTTTNGRHRGHSMLRQGGISSELIVKRFRMARARDGRSQDKVLAAMGMARGKLAKFESSSGDLARDLEFVAKLAQQYQVSADWLLGLTDELRTLDGRGDEPWAAAYGRLSPARQQDLLALAQFFAFVDSREERSRALVAMRQRNIEDLRPIENLLVSIEGKGDPLLSLSGDLDAGE